MNAVCRHVPQGHSGVAPGHYVTSTLVRHSPSLSCKRRHFIPARTPTSTLPTPRSHRPSPLNTRHIHLPLLKPSLSSYPASLTRSSAHSLTNSSGYELLLQTANSPATTHTALHPIHPTSLSSLRHHAPFKFVSGPADAPLHYSCDPSNNKYSGPQFPAARTQTTTLTPKRHPQENVERERTGLEKQARE
ncbi:hypothetical protein BDN71DRAFT_1512769 [Pleurotus eryngii]|uniref:Uncharacterized protein n=1 Tax=Pleurotus eryngii TaxID=5323 RepID=A0A9P6DAK1_PLEER|nr:hypothetical protein BDN71DRAFT_1512769 [Pleurotus eryngii]